MTRIAFTGVQFLDGEHPARGPVTIVVNGPRIEKISDHPRAADGVERKINVAGRTIMPGMVMAHFHATYYNLTVSSPPIGLEAPVPLQTLRAVRNLEALMDHGFTSAVSAGAPWAIDTSLKMAIEAGTIRGPRLVPCGRDVSTTGHAADGSPWYWQLPAEVLPVNRCDGPDEFRRGVREEIRRGAEIIKVFASPGHAVPGDPQLVDVTEAELAAAAEAAHQRGALIRAHVANKASIMRVLDAGFDVIDHGDGLDGECIDRIAGTDVVVVPSLVFVDRLAAGLLAGTRAGDAMRADINQMLEVLPKANRAGVKLSLGDDYGAVGLPHEDFGYELEYYVRTAGIPALDVIRWATVNGARLVDRGKGPGPLKEGALADLLIVDGDPVKDITLLRKRERILAVMKDGVFYKEPPQVLEQQRTHAA
jgi:imidazolonepropionase-like amidohydrolase